MIWAKENPFLTGLIVVAAAILGGVGYFAYSNYAQYAEWQATYESEVQRLHQLQNASPFPSQENLQKIKESTEVYQKALTELATSLAAFQMPLNKEVSPQQFQDELRKAVSQTQAKAAESGVKLPTDFYLGFEAYRAGLPSQEATPALARQLRAIEAVINGLIATRVTEISQFARAPLAIEAGVAPSRPTTPAAGQRPNSAPVPAKPLERSLLDVSFSGEQGRMRLALNSLLNSPQFLIIRALKVQNSAMSSPTKVRKEDSEESSPKTPPDSAAKSQGALNMLFGRETIAVQLRIELLEFDKTTPEPTGQAK